MELESKIEALLFFKGEPVRLKDLAAAFKVEATDVEAALKKLEASLVGRGVTLVRTEDEVALGTQVEMSKFFEELRKEELNKELSKAALETLSIILYKNLATRTEINFIRGVNSSFILRALEVRGLVEKVTHKTDARMYAYKPTLELLSFMGVTDVSKLPKFEEIKKTIEDKLLNQNEGVGNEETK